MNLMTEDEMREVVQARIKSREWFVIPIASPMSQTTARAIEEKFYKGDKNADFELVMIPRPTEDCFMLGIAFAHKRQMSSRDLHKLSGFKDRDAMGQPLDQSRDVILTPDLPLSVVQWLLNNFDGN